MRRLFGAVMALMLAGVTSTGLAHHSVSGVFDGSTPFELTGTITEVEWINPHVYIHLDVEDEDGHIVSWALETAPTQFFRNAGVSKAMLQGDGKPVTITGIRGHDKSKLIGWISRITYADGRFIQI
jgi:Family of unknown function (DUF6152)